MSGRNSNNAMLNILSSPFYILSIGVAGLIFVGLCLMALQNYLRRRRYQRRFLELVRSGYVVPVFDLRDDANQDLSKSKQIPQITTAVIPKLHEVGSGKVAVWAEIQPLGLTSVPPAPTSTKTFLNLLSPPSLFTRLRREVDDTYPTVPHLVQQRSQASAHRSTARSDRQAQEQSTDIPLTPIKATADEQPDKLQLSYIIAMPSPKPSRPFSTASLHLPELTDIDLCLGTYQLMWNRSSLPLTPPETPALLPDSHPSLVSSSDAIAGQPAADLIANQGSGPQTPAQSRNHLPRS